jgi:hypothetical protein
MVRPVLKRCKNAIIKFARHLAIIARAFIASVYDAIAFRASDVANSARIRIKRRHESALFTSHSVR